MILTIIYAILIFLILIFVHETGHLLTAKATGIRVNEFALGMGPKIFSVQRGETKYSLRWIPIGGYCAMEGEDEDSDDPRAFGNKPAKVRALVLFAGSLMNILLAIVLLSLIIFSDGEPSRKVETVVETNPVYADGIRPGDEFVSVNNIPVDNWRDVLKTLNSMIDDSTEEIMVSFAIVRDGSELTIDTHFIRDEAGEFKIGMSPVYEKSVSYFFKSFGYGARATVSMTRMMYEVIGDLVTGQAGMDQLTGPIGIVMTVEEIIPYGMVYVLQLTALISLNLGIVNLLPFPALDGGRLIFLLIRKITGKRVTDRIEGIVHMIGIMVLFGFMILITFQDIGRFILPGN